MEPPFLACTDETARTEPDEADKTVMGASCTGSYEVTNVRPVTCKDGATPTRPTHPTAGQQRVGQAESQTARGDLVPHILTVRRL